jgi:hypothetical protein
MAPAGAAQLQLAAGGIHRVRINSSVRISRKGQVMELSNYELVRYPSGQLVLMKGGLNAQGHPSGGPKDVIGVFTDEVEAQNVLARLVASHGLNAPQESQRSLSG